MSENQEQTETQEEHEPQQQEQEQKNEEEHQEQTQEHTENEENKPEGEIDEEELKRRKEEEEEKKRQAEEEERRALEEAKKLHIITQEFVEFPHDEGEVVTDLKYFANECKKLKNTQRSIRKVLKQKKSAEWWYKCDADGNTLMHIAMKNCWLVVFDELMKSHPGAIYAKNKEGKTPLTLFLEQPQTEDHMIMFNLVNIFYHQLSPEMREEIKEYANREENVYYKSVLNQDASEMTRESSRYL